ncbi:MAG: ion channel [Candidatus Promineifilaceae bacterium]|nr:ion channel [Candidatus Promineifilaceae bacterium]
MNEKEAFQINDKNYKPYTHLNFKNDPYEFQFVVITDNAGTARQGVFAKAVEMANWLQPEFVVHAGDLIEGYDENEEQIRAWWQEIDEFLEPLEMPFFFLPGNHDINTDATVKVWRERFGGVGRYYHFRYKDVLFLMVDTEDPPKQLAALQHDNPELYTKVFKNYAAMGKIQAKENKTAEDLAEFSALAQPIEEWLADIHISAALFHWLESWNWLDSFYFVVITLTTIGYGDLSPTTPLTKLITIFVALNGVAILLILLDEIRRVRRFQIDERQGAHESEG